MNPAAQRRPRRGKLRPGPQSIVLWSQVNHTCRPRAPGPHSRPSRARKPQKRHTPAIPRRGSTPPARSTAAPRPNPPDPSDLIRTPTIRTCFDLIWTVRFGSSSRNPCVPVRPGTFVKETLRFSIINPPSSSFQNLFQLGPGFNTLAPEFSQISTRNPDLSFSRVRPHI